MRVTASPSPQPQPRAEGQRSVAPVVLAILDGWGYRHDNAHNAIRSAATPVMDALWHAYPHTLIQASGGDVGLDVAYRIESNGAPVLDARSGAVEQGLFQIVLDHEDNRAVLARQATERLPVSRTYLPTLFVNLIGQRSS